MDKPINHLPEVFLKPYWKSRVSLSEFEMGFPLMIKDKKDQVYTHLTGDRMVAIPFRHRASGVRIAT